MAKYLLLNENVLSDKVIAAANILYQCISRAIVMYRQNGKHKVIIFIPRSRKSTKIEYDYYMDGCFDYINNYYARKLVKSTFAKENIKIKAYADEELLYNRTRRLVTYDNGYIVKCKF